MSAPKPGSHDLGFRIDPEDRPSLVSAQPAQNSVLDDLTKLSKSFVAKALAEGVSTLRAHRDAARTRMASRPWSGQGNRREKLASERMAEMRLDGRAFDRGAPQSYDDYRANDDYGSEPHLSPRADSPATKLSRAEPQLRSEPAPRSAPEPRLDPAPRPGPAWTQGQSDVSRPPVAPSAAPVLQPASPQMAPQQTAGAVRSGRGRRTDDGFHFTFKRPKAATRQKLNTAAPNPVPRVQPPQDAPRHDESRFAEPHFAEPHFAEPRLDRPRFEEPRLDEPRLDEPRLSAAPPRQDHPRLVVEPRLDHVPLSSPSSASAPRSGRGIGGGNAGRAGRALLAALMAKLAEVKAARPKSASKAKPSPSAERGSGGGGKGPTGRGPAGSGSGSGGRKGGKGKLLGRLLGWGISAGIWFAMALACVVAYYAYDLPPLDSLTSTTRRPSVTLLSADGQTIAAYGDVYGEPLTLQDMPPAIPAAVMATEDRHFYSHFGIDVIGLIRASVVNLRAGHVVQGGSTITQQLAKNLFLTPERSLKRKVQELLMALWLEHKFTKDQIITLYLNRVYLGSGSWGVDAAAKRYFGTSAHNLNLYQSALLAGLLKAPSRYNPQNDRDLSYKRTSQVLLNMVAVGSITQQQMDEALKVGPTSVKQISHTGRYFADWVRDLADQYAHGDRDIVVHTTLDLALQRKVEADLEETLAKNGPKAGVTQGAMVVMSPDGAIRAMAGGRDYAQSQFNRAVQGMRQPGSSFKAFLYLAAVESGMTADSPIEDSPIQTGKYQPSNYTHKYEGTITLRRALAKSSNVAAVRLIEQIGPRRVVAVAKRLGITSELHADASLALGTSEVSLLEMTSAYASFANNGYGVFPYAFAEVDDPQGNPLYRREGNGTGRVIEPQALREINYLLSGVIEEGSGKSAAIDRPAAGKTGTTQDYRDAWFMGFTADYVGGVWFGNDDGTSMHKITGGTLPTQLWHTVMLAAHKGLPVRPLPGLGPEPDATAPVPQENMGGAGVSSSGQPESNDSIWNGLVKMLGGG